jgi:hypothetical protein
MAVAVFLYLQPQRIAKQSELNRVKSQVAAVQGDINRTAIEFDQLAVQQKQFENLKARGFFNNQGRRAAEKSLEQIQQEAGVILAVADIRPGVLADNEEAAKAEYRVLKSPLAIKVTAIDSRDIYRYIYLLDKFFPGHLTYNRIRMERKAEVTGTVLRAIAADMDNPPVLVEAELEMVWSTMIPQSEVITGEAPAPGGAQ